MDEIRDKKEYELSYLLSADIAEDTLEAEKDELSKIILQSNGTVGDLEIPVKRRLAYPVRKQNQAYFGIASIKMAEEKLEDLKKSLSLNKKYLRFLIVNKPIEAKLPAAPAPAIEEKTGIATESFDQKLESILKR